MEIITRCPSCRTRVAFDPVKIPESGYVCSACGQSTPIDVSESIRTEGMVDVCPSCGKKAFYVQRDFNRKLGLVIVFICAIVGLVFIYNDMPVYFYLSLGTGVLIDLVLYASLPQVTICYSCQAIFRDALPNPEHGPFDLHIADHYEGRSQG